MPTAKHHRRAKMGSLEAAVRGFASRRGAAAGAGHAAADAWPPALPRSRALPCSRSQRRVPNSCPASRPAQDSPPAVRSQVTNWEKAKPRPAAFERRCASLVGFSSLSAYSSDTCRNKGGCELASDAPTALHTSQNEGRRHTAAAPVRWMAAFDHSAAHHAACSPATRAKLAAHH